MNKKQKNTKFMYNVTIILLLLIIAISSCIGIFAWARYTSTVNGTATAQVAKWSFKLVDGVTETKDVIDFAITRTDGYGKVVDNRLAPGTFGEFEVGIDARGTETILEYIINVKLENKPTYMKLYSDEQKTQEILVENNEFSIKGFMSLEDVKEIRTEKIYWDWPYENNDDVTDTFDAGKTMKMKLSVTGYEVLEPSTDQGISTRILSNVVKAGDYVNYNASSNGTKTFTNSDCLAGSSVSATISTDDSFNSDTIAQWKVLNVDKATGIIELVSTDPTTQTVKFSGGNGFVNGETVLNNIGAIYGQGKGAIKGRSITLKDIEKYSRFDKTKSESKYSNTGYYGGTNSYTSGNFYKEIKDEEGNVTGYETTTTVASSSKPVTVTHTHYMYMAKNTLFSDENIYNIIFKNSTNTSDNKPTYWLASRYANLQSDYCNYGLFTIYLNCLYDHWLINSKGEVEEPAYAIVPIVSLESNIKTTGQDENGVWQLKLD